MDPTLSVAEVIAIAKPGEAIRKTRDAVANARNVVAAEAKVAAVDKEVKMAEADYFVCSTSTAMDSYLRRRLTALSPCWPNLMSTKTERSTQKN
jgi:hypothetical protein